MRTLALAALALVLTGCVRSYNVLLVNNSTNPIALQLTQFHSKTFTGERPANFTDYLKVGSRSVALAAGETKVVSFNDASGGFWVRWCKEGTAEPCGIVDLIRDTLEIRVH